MAPTGSARNARRLGLLAFGFAAAVSLAGCQNDDLVAAAMPDDYHNRHPIVLTDAPTILDVFPTGVGALDAHSVADVRAFAGRYAKYGVGKIVVLAPSHGGPKINAGVAAVRRALASAGVTGNIGLGTYNVADPLLAAPIKLSFLALKAEAPPHCGQWPQDLASGSSLETWQNRQYWNFGCATQTMLAEQVDDPRDFVRAGALAPSDVEMRLRAITAVRNGADPGTGWQVRNSEIGQIGGS